jgi:hypothetical protein
VSCRTSKVDGTLKKSRDIRASIDCCCIAKSTAKCVQVIQKYIIWVRVPIESFIDEGHLLAGWYGKLRFRDATLAVHVNCGHWVLMTLRVMLDQVEQEREEAS